jgi:hypothetical protein
MHVEEIFIVHGDALWTRLSRRRLPPASKRTSPGIPIPNQLLRHHRQVLQQLGLKHQRLIVGDPIILWPGEDLARED